MRIAIDRFGNPWVVNAAGNVYMRTNGIFQVKGGMANKAQDIGVGVDGSVWITGTDSGIKKYNYNSDTFVAIDGAAT